MKKILKKFRLGAVALTMLTLSAVIFYACEKEDIQSDNLTEVISEKPLSQEHKELLNCLGFNTADATEDGEYVQVEGDIFLDKNMINDFLSIQNEEFDSQTVQSRQQALNEGTLISMNNVSQIKVYIDPSITAPSPNIHREWYLPIAQALVDWNDIPHCSVKFSITSSANQANLKIILKSNVTPISVYPKALGNYASNFFALACLPANGKVGGFISLNNDYSANSKLTVDQKKWLLRHELGHTLGLRHMTTPNCNGAKPNEPISGNDACSYFTGNYQIWGTPPCDASSVMKTEGKYTYNLSSYDVKAAQYMYPDPYNKPIIVGYSTKAYSSTKKEVNISVNAPTRPIYRLFIERYSANATNSSNPLETSFINDVGVNTTFKFLSPKGKWKIKVSRENFGTYKVKSDFFDINVQ